jgi:hypothetical protein
MVPSTSDGVGWEVQQLRQMQLLPHVIWVMPPGYATPSGEVEWNAARSSLLALGLQLPEFEHDGALVLLDAEGRMRSRFSFDLVWTGELAELVRTHVWRGLPPFISAET